MAGSYRNGSHLEGCQGAKIVSVNNVMRVLVTPLQNKRGMSAFDPKPISQVESISGDLVSGEADEFGSDRRAANDKHVH